MLRKLLIIALLIVPPAVQTQEPDQTNPWNLMRYVADKTFSRLKKEQPLIQKNPEHLREVVTEELIPYVHIKYAGALVLGTLYQQATPAQRDAYFAAFQQYIEQAYAQILAFYSGQHYEISEGTVSQDAVIVPIRITIVNSNSNQLPIRLDFQWRKNSKTGYWQAYDMIAEGVSMIATKQNEWAEILRLQGIDGLTKQLVVASKQPIALTKKLP